MRHHNARSMILQSRIVVSSERIVSAIIRDSSQRTREGDGVPRKIRKLFSTVDTLTFLAGSVNNISRPASATLLHAASRPDSVPSLTIPACASLIHVYRLLVFPSRKREKRSRRGAGNGDDRGCIDLWRPKRGSRRAADLLRCESQSQPILRPCCGPCLLFSHLHQSNLSSPFVIRVCDSRFPCRPNVTRDYSLNIRGISITISFRNMYAIHIGVRNINWIFYDNRVQL